MSERYRAVLLASLPGRQRRAQMAALPAAERDRLGPLITQVLAMTAGDRATLLTVLAELRPPQTVPEPLRAWLAEAGPEWAALLVRSLDPEDRRRQLLEPLLTPAATTVLPTRLQSILSAIAEDALPLPGPPPLGAFG